MSVLARRRHGTSIGSDNRFMAIAVPHFVALAYFCSVYPYSGYLYSAFASIQNVIYARIPGQSVNVVSIEL